MTVLVMLASIVAACSSNETASLPPGTAQNPQNTTTVAPTTALPASTPTPDAILKLVNTASAGMNTFESSAVMSMNMSLMDMTVKADMTANMTVDVPGKKFFMSAGSQTGGVGTPSSNSTQMYLINDTLYTKTDGDSSLDPNTWYKEVVTTADQSSMWKTEDVGGQIQILLDSATLVIVGSEDVNAEPCYKLEVNPNMDKFLAYLDATGNGMSDLGITSASQAFKQLDVNIWVAKTNYLPARVDIVMVLNAQGMDISVNMSSTYNKVNLPVTITLPAPAQNALPMPG